jgi:hydroxymethylpyrimidine kinase/phosphomethylpyrimidine kinase/thiamine-phosphate diphosphorylase
VAPAIRDAVALGRRHGARLFINDYWQQAIEAAPGACIWGRRIWRPPISPPFRRRAAPWHLHPRLLRADAGPRAGPLLYRAGSYLPDQHQAMPSRPQGWRGCTTTAP